MSNRPGRAIKRQQARTRPAPTESRPFPVRWAILTGLMVLAAVLLAVALTVGDDEEPTAGEQTAFARIIGDPLPAYEGQPPDLDPAVGTTAPAIVASNFAGEPVTVDPADGTPKVLIFFAHWCSHCQAELPRLVEWTTEDPVTDIDVVGISTAVQSGAPNYPPSAWFDREGWEFPVLRDSENSVLDLGFGGPGYPRFVVIGADGTIVARGAGEIAQSQWNTLVDLARAGT